MREAQRAVRLRRATTIVCYWCDDQLVYENYLTRHRISADPALTLLINFFDHWSFPSELLFGVPAAQMQGVRRVIRQLLQHTLLVRQGSPEAKRDAEFAQAWNGWQPHAAFFHYASKDVKFRSSERDIRTMLTQFLAEAPQPSFFKSNRKLTRVELARAWPSRGIPGVRHAASRPSGLAASLESGPRVGDADALFRVLLARRTHRKFSRDPLSRGDLEQLLFYTWGVTGYARVPPLGDVPLKTSPSGGARHPEEVYVLALRVHGLPAGLYHYLPRDHALEQLRAGRVQGCAVRYCAGQKFTGNAAALFIMTAVIERNRWKYRMARAYRILLTEAGHLCQVFCLVATALGLAPFCTMALADSLIERELGLDGIHELPLYVAGVGLPSVQS